MDGNSIEQQTVAALVTPPGSGGIAVIEVRGPAAGEIVSRVFVPKTPGDWLSGAPGRLHYGHVRDGDVVIDEVLVRLASREAGVDAVEVNCHGGIVAAGETMRLLVEAGAAEATPAQMSERCARSAGLDKVQAEAMRLLPSAKTRLAVRVIADQLNGALSRAVRSVDPAGPSAPELLGALAASAAFGLALTHPRRLVLVGSPNAGKSTLFNALVGHSRTIVSPTPGTTRDFINELIALGGYPVELVDTAGLRRHGDVVEMMGVEATWGVVSEADLVVIVADGSHAPTPSEGELMRALLPREPILAVNKCDLGAPATGQPAGAQLVVRPISALTGEGVPNLTQAILERFPGAAAYPPGSAVALTREQEAALRSACAHCLGGRADEAACDLSGLLE